MWKSCHRATWPQAHHVVCNPSAHWPRGSSQLEILGAQGNKRTKKTKQQQQHKQIHNELQEVAQGKDILSIGISRESDGS